MPSTSEARETAIERREAGAQSRRHGRKWGRGGAVAAGPRIGARSNPPISEAGSGAEREPRRNFGPSRGGNSFNRSLVTPGTRLGGDHLSGVPQRRQRLGLSVRRGRTTVSLIDRTEVRKTSSGHRAAGRNKRHFPAACRDAQAAIADRDSCPTAHGHDCAPVVASFLPTPLAAADGAAVMHERPGSRLPLDKRVVTRLRRLTVAKCASGSPCTRASCSHLAGRLIFTAVAIC